MSENPTETLFFGGRYYHGVDAKRRVQVPAKWRPENGTFRYFVMLRKHGTAGYHLRVMPPKEMNRMRDEVDRKVEQDPSKSPLRRSLGSDLDCVDLDAGGRICLPPEMAKAAGIGPNADVVLVGALNYFEIWHLDRHKKVSEADAAFKPEMNNIVA